MCSVRIGDMKKFKRPVGYIPTLQKGIVKEPPENKISFEKQAKVDVVMGILEEGLEKLKISFFLPIILNNIDFVKNLLCRTRQKEVVKVLEDFRNLHEKKEKIRHIQEAEERKAAEEAADHLRSSRLSQGSHPSDPPTRRPRPSKSENPFKKSDNLIEREIGQIEVMDADLACFIDYFFTRLDIVRYLPMLMDELPERDRQTLEHFKKLMDLTKLNMLKSPFIILEMEPTLLLLDRQKRIVLLSIFPIHAEIKKTVMVRKVKRVAKKVYIKRVQQQVDLKEDVMDHHKELSRLQIKSQFDIVSHESRKSLTKLKDELENMKIQFKKVKKENDERVSSCRRELHKQILQYEKLVRKRDKILLEKFQEISELKEIYVIEEAKAKANEAVYEKARQRYEDIVVTYRLNKMRNFWKKMMVLKIETWICKQWKRIEQKKLLEEQARKNRKSQNSMSSRKESSQH